MSELGHCTLSWGDRNRIERAVDQVDGLGRPVKVFVEHNGKRYRVLVTAELNQERVLAARRARGDN